MKRAILISNRCAVFDELRRMREIDLLHVFAVPESPLHQAVAAAGVPHALLGSRKAEPLLRDLARLEFDLLISNGCPVILPITRMHRPNQLFINVHPSLLPQLRGYHPANGALLQKQPVAGATMHFMEDTVDTGNIIHQEQFPVTEDLDLGLVYHLLFALEGRVFANGMRKLAASEFADRGQRQTGVGSSYQRHDDDMAVDFQSMSAPEIVTRVRAFGVRTQGVRCKLANVAHRLFEAQVVVNPLLLEMHADAQPGAIVLRYDGKLLVKAGEGLVRVSNWTVIE